MKRRRPTRLPRWHELSIYGLLALLLSSGVAWLIFDKWVRVAGDFGPEHHPAQHLLIIAHGVAAYFFILIAGALIPLHVKSGWAMSRNLKSGLALASALAITALTALALYYLGGETARSWSSIVHWVIGIAASILLVVHAMCGLKSIRPSSRKPAYPASLSTDARFASNPNNCAGTLAD